MAYNKFHSYNDFSTLPFIPYNIISKLMISPSAEDLFKLLKYDNYNALDNPNLTINEKKELIWKGQDRSEDYRIFLSDISPNMFPDACTFIKCYRYEGNPENLITANEIYRFDFLYGTKMAMIEYGGIPCNRGDVIEMLLQKTLNGANVKGAGYFEYTRKCATRANLGDNEKFTGYSLLMATKIASTEDGETCE